jgi:hypothetical protein
MTEIMPEPLSRQQSMGKLDALLLSSVRRYEDILTLFAAINSDIGGKNPATLELRGTELLQLQEQAALADRDLIATLQEKNIDESAHPLLNKRQDIMQQILHHNRSLLTTVSNIKSLLAHEIKEMQGGRAALHGYCQSTPARNGDIFKGSL